MSNCTKDIMMLTPAELADELSMISKECLLVEGESDRVFWKHLQLDGLMNRNIYIANKKDCTGNKEYVKKVIKLLNIRKRRNVIGIIDPDYDYVRGNIEELENLYYYKYIDLENVLIQSSSFSEVNSLISSRNKKLDDSVLRNRLYDKAYILGILRLLNEKEQLNFDFDKIDYKKLLKDDRGKFVNYFMTKLNLGKPERESMLLKIEELIKYRYDGLYICNGHDLLKILSLLTSKEISNDNPVRYDEEILQQMMVLGYRKTNIAEDVFDCTDVLCKLP